MRLDTVVLEHAPQGDGAYRASVSERPVMLLAGPPPVVRRRLGWGAVVLGALAVALGALAVVLGSSVLGQVR